jgi:hypothetical protein
MGVQIDVVRFLREFREAFLRELGEGTVVEKDVIARFDKVALSALLVLCEGEISKEKEPEPSRLTARQIGGLKAWKTQERKKRLTQEQQVRKETKLAQERVLYACTPEVEG